MHPWQNHSPILVLASGSTTRRALLAQAGITATVRPAGIDETVIKRAARRAGSPAGAAAMELAEAKAVPVSRSMPDALVIGADQILSAGSVWFDKPVDLAEARAQLASMRGRTQILHTAVVLARAGEILWRHLVEPGIAMRACSDSMLDWYLSHEGDALLDCVGACRVEGAGQLLVETPGAEHAAILGLPMRALIGELRRREVLHD